MKDTTKVFGYVRVSSKEQNEARQIAAFKAIGIDDRDIFVDKISGNVKADKRPKFKALLACLREGDTVVICSLDRLGRDYTEVRNDWNSITKEYRAHIKVLDMPLLDTTNAIDGLDRQFISDLVLQILSYVADKERGNIRERQRQGIVTAKAKGVRLGRPPVQFPDNFTSVYQTWRSGEITAVEAMRQTGLKTTSFYKLVNQHKGRIERGEARG